MLYFHKKNNEEREIIIIILRVEKIQNYMIDGISTTPQCSKKEADPGSEDTKLCSRDK